MGAERREAGSLAGDAVVVGGVGEMEVEALRAADGGGGGGGGDVGAGKVS